MIVLFIYKLLVSYLIHIYYRIIYLNVFQLYGSLLSYLVVINVINISSEFKCKGK